MTATMLEYRFSVSTPVPHTDEQIMSQTRGALRFISTRYGGATAIPHIGAWKDGAEVVHMEHGLTFIVGIPAKGFRISDPKVVAGILARAFKQRYIYVSRPGGNAEIVDCDNLPHDKPAAA